MSLLPDVPGARTQALTLLNLQTMPCGCIAAVYQAGSGPVELEQVEAKGPNCRFYAHRLGRVMRLGVPDPSFGDAGEGQEPRV
jgi:hypothetical protein